MAINSEIRDQAYQFFLEEAPELLHTIESGILNLSQDHSTAHVHQMMRAAHSLKGGSASLEFHAISTVAHRLETIFKALYSEQIEITTDLESQLLQAYDCLRLPLQQQLENGEHDSEPTLATAEAIFAQLEEQLEDALKKAANYIPSSSELGIDMALSIFEVDVAEGLERLTQVVTHPHNYEVAGELRAQAEVFDGFAQLLDISEFGAIAKAAISALEVHPERALEITQLALADFRAGREAILAGQPVSKPSNLLIALSNPSNHTPELSEIVIEEQDDALLEDIFGSVTEAPELESEESSVTLAEFELNSQSIPDNGVFADIVNHDDETDEIVDLPLESSAAHSEPIESFLVDEDEDREAASSSAIVPIASTSHFLQQQYWEAVESGEAPETLDVALRDIEQLFERLPSLEDMSGVSNETEADPRLGRNGSYREEEDISTTGFTQSPQRKQSSNTPNLSIRVDAQRLGRTNNLVGELAINRNSLSLQNQQLQAAVRELLTRFSQFQRIVDQVRELSDQMLVASPLRDNQSPIMSVNELGELALTQAEFDALELDNYNSLHARLHSLLEDMVQLEESVDDIGLFAKQSDRTIKQQRQILTQLRDELMWAQMLPLGNILNRFPRVIRDLSTKYRKPAELKLSGMGVLVDKAVLERLHDPLLHLLRNAFDHGIETSDIRQKANKSPSGHIEIRAYHKGSQTIIEVSDDGRGINLDKVSRRALELGWLSAEQLSNTTREQLFEFIFRPGFSTAEQVSELSGRGVGLDVVRAQLRSLKGSVSVTSSLGKGTTFTLKLPLTQTIAKLIVCLVGTSAIALPTDSIEEIVVPQGEQLQKAGSKRFLHWRNEIVPIHRLADLLEYGCPLPETLASKALTSVPAPVQWALPLLVLRLNQHVFALEIDRLVTEQELVIKPFGAVLNPPNYAYGCTILGDGSLVPVIDGTLLLERVQGQGEDSLNLPVAIPTDEGSVPQRPKAPVRTMQAPTVLIVDDAAALRRTLALTLERAGFRVLQAPDGQEALRQWQQSSAVQLIICDIEMPNMNGFEFLKHRRQEPELLKIPVVMLTSRSNQKHQWLAMHLGATAYFTKPFIEQGFLQAIKDIIDQHSLSSPVAVR